MGVGTASGIRVAPLAQENNPDQQCTGHAQSLVVRLTIARRPAAGGFKLSRQMALCAATWLGLRKRRTLCRFAVARTTTNRCGNGPAIGPCYLSLNCPRVVVRSLASSASDWLALPVWLVRTADCADKSRMRTRLRSTSRATSACSSEALAITVLRSSITMTELAMLASTALADSACCLVRCACSVLTSSATRVLLVPCWMCPIMVSISRVDSLVRWARARTSSATTAKPRPASPARAASMAALRASRLVCSDTARITSRTLVISSVRVASACASVEAVPTFRVSSRIDLTV
ncbi:hypothetical protein ALO42_102694 [Pseudomonas syringae pv. atrofaciens]|nr:hypothetical protein ALO42_102694 [Pseudomonas syringae pv. atrofaciens]